MSSKLEERIDEVLAALNTQCTPEEGLFYVIAGAVVCGIALAAFVLLAIISLWLFAMITRFDPEILPERFHLPRTVLEFPKFYILFLIPETVIFSVGAWYFCEERNVRTSYMFAIPLLCFHSIVILFFYRAYFVELQIGKPGRKCCMQLRKLWQYLVLSLFYIAPPFAILIGSCIFLSAEVQYRSRDEYLFHQFEFCSFGSDFCNLTDSSQSFLAVQLFDNGVYSLQPLYGLPLGAACYYEDMNTTFCVRNARANYFEVPELSLIYDLVPVLAISPIVFVPFLFMVFLSKGQLIVLDNTRHVEESLDTRDTDSPE